MEIIETGLLHDEAGTFAIAERAADLGYDRAVVSKEEFMTHYWFLIDEDSIKLMYIGTPESFEKWRLARLQ